MRDSTLVLGLVLLVATGCASTGRRQEGALASNAPEDRPAAIHGDSPDEALSRWHALIEPHSRRALASYASARQRYRQGLPAGHNFLVTIILRDPSRRFEQVFILVDKIDDGTVTGRLFSDILTVEGYRRGATLSFQESEIVDWTIARPDGSEEGNFVGKFLDTLQGG